jgi:hypothetical protein
MKKRKFLVTFTDNADNEYDAEIELDQKVIDQVDDDWRKCFYNLETPEQIAKHIAYNLVINNYRLSQLDGWADLDDNMADIITFDEFEGIEVSDCQELD